MRRGGRWVAREGQPSPEAIYQALKALPLHADEEAVASVTGDNRWTQNICDECGADAAITVALGAEIHHATDTAYICLSCLQRAVALAGSVGNQTGSVN